MLLQGLHYILFGEMVEMCSNWISCFPSIWQKYKSMKKFTLICVVHRGLFQVSRYFFTAGCLWTTSSLQFARNANSFILPLWTECVHRLITINGSSLDILLRSNNEQSPFMALIICSYSWKEKILSLVTIVDWMDLIQSITLSYVDSDPIEKTKEQQIKATKQNKTIDSIAGSTGLGKCALGWWGKWVFKYRMPNLDLAI